MAARRLTKFGVGRPRHMTDRVGYVLRLVIVVLLLSILTGCAPRGAVHFDARQVAPGQSVQKVFIATNRQRASGSNGGFFNQEFGETRDHTLHFARMDISVPPSHQIGKIEWPGYATPNPARHFVVQNEVLFASHHPFLDNLYSSHNERDVFVFVHGFNLNNAEAVYRLAQISHDFEARLPVIAFSWPSAGSPQGYAYDRDSVIFSRDGLEELIEILIADRRRVFLVAHSLGSQLVMETLRQMSLAGKQKALSQLAGVVLISPDVDEDVFLQQARRIDPMPQPFALLVNQNDKALNVAAFLTGKPQRLGGIQQPERLSGLPIEIIDLTGVEGGDLSSHSTAFTAPEAIDMLRNWQTQPH